MKYLVTSRKMSKKGDEFEGNSSPPCSYLRIQAIP